MFKKHFHTPTKTLLALALISLLAACNSSDDDEKDNNGHHSEHSLSQSMGRLVYSLDNAAGLQIYDQTVEASERFTATNVSSENSASLVLAKSGLTTAVLEGERLSVVSSGLEHMQSDHAHTHDVELLTPSSFTGVTKVVATGDYFSTLTTSGASDLINSQGEVTSHSWSNVVYPTLALAGDHFLKFTSGTGGAVNLTVVDNNNSTGGGSIYLRPNNEWEMVESLSCPDGIKDAAQTENLALVLCGDGSLRWLISDYVPTNEGHPKKGEHLYITQKYAATTDRLEGATGEVTKNSNEFIRGIQGLTATFDDDNVIAAWSDDQLWLVNGHNDHPHRGDLSSILGADFGKVLNVAATTDDDALAVISDSGKIAITRFDIENNNPVKKGEVIKEQLGEVGALWTSSNSQLLAGANEFFAIQTHKGVLYHLDAHSDEDDYHLHGTHQHDSLQQLHSGVFAHFQDDHDDHDDDHSHGSH